MDINSAIGQDIYRSIERGRMLPTQTGFRCEDTGWSYDVTNMDYFVRRKSAGGLLERIYVGMPETIPVEALDAGEQLRVGTAATYDELLCPRTLPPNVLKNIRPKTYSATKLLADIRERGYEVLEHDPGKWPYFVKPFPQGVSSNVRPTILEAEHDRWPINRTIEIKSGFEHGVPRNFAAGQPAAPPPYLDDERPAPQPALIGARMAVVQPETAAQEEERRDARRARQDAQWAARHPGQDAAVLGFGVSVVAGIVCVVGAVVGLVVVKTYRALQR